MPSSSLTLNAWVIGGRHRHHRTRDHFGADSDLYIALSEPIGPWAIGTPIKFVLSDLYARQIALESADHQVRVFYMDAYVLSPETTEGGLGVTWLDALVFKNMSSSFAVDAMVLPGGSFTLDAYVKGTGAFYLNAYVV